MHPISTLIVDDEIGAINTLRGMVSMYCPELQIVGHARSVPAAVGMMHELKPDLVFLDIEMTPSGNGFDFIDQTRQYAYGVIFTTAYPQYAIQAIKMIQPWYYLVKPIDLLELQEAVKVAVRKIQDNMESDTGQADHNLVIPVGRKNNAILKMRQILFCKADLSVSEIYLLKEGGLEKVTAFCTIGNLEKRLTGHGFFRSHHGYLVNMHKLEGYARNGRSGIAYLPEGFQVPVSVSKMKEFEAAIKSGNRNVPLISG